LLSLFYYSVTQKCVKSVARGSTLWQIELSEIHFVWQPKPAGWQRRSPIGEIRANPRFASPSAFFHVTVDSLLAESDSLRLFLQEAVENADGMDVSVNEIAEAYATFCPEKGWNPLPITEIHRSLEGLMLELFRVTKSHSVERDGESVRGFLESPSSDLDISKLERVRTNGAKTKARCPARAEAGDDQKGEHLFIYADGRFGCVVYPGDSADAKAHRRRIFALCDNREFKPLVVRRTVLGRSGRENKGCPAGAPLKTRLLGCLGRVFETHLAGKQTHERRGRSKG
jgi:hypothetical protein